MRGAWRFQQFTKRLLPRAIILLYHRVAELLPDPQLLAVTPQHFAQHLEILRNYGHPAQLKRIDEILRYRNIGHRTVIVTFDDGYADNLYNAKPLLERYEIPATVFVATGYTDNSREFSSDELERVLLQPGTLPQMLRLTVDGKTHQWDLREAARYSEEGFERNRFWNVADPENPTPRHLVYRSLHTLLRPLPPGDRRRALDDLLNWAGVNCDSRPTHRALSPDEVVRLAAGGLVDIGCHTVTHPVLSALPTAMQRREIIRSKTRLEEVLGQRVGTFAYPYGTRSDYSEETVTIVREAGFSLACSNFPGLVQRAVPLYELPRLLVRDWNGEEFARRLQDWFRA